MERNALAIHKFTLTPERRSIFEEAEKNKMLSKPWYDANEVTEALKPHTRELATLLLETPNQHMSTTQQLRFGKSGKIIVNLGGSKAGIWHDFGSGEGGNLLKLIERERQVGFKEALHYGAEFAGLSPDQRQGNSKAIQAPKSEKPEVLELKEQQSQHSKLARVQRLYEESQPIQGTIAECYLKDHRAIQAELPESLRFHAGIYEPQTKQKLPALIAFATDNEGTLKAAQVTYLDVRTARKVDKDKIAVNKRSQGIVKGSFVKLQEGEGPVYIAEGVETALSIKEAGVKGTIIASLGISNMRNYVTEFNLQDESFKIIICADNDGSDSNTQKLVDKVVKEPEEKGCSVSIIRPLREGFDFNDVLKQEGLVKVAHYVQSTLQRAQITSSIDADHPRSQQSELSKEELLPKVMAEPQGGAEKAQVQKVSPLTTPYEQEAVQTHKIASESSNPSQKAEAIQNNQANKDLKPNETVPSIEAYQDLLRERRYLSQRGKQDPEIHEAREVIQDKINAMAHSLVQDPQMMAKAKEVDLHMSIERMALLHGRSKPSKELPSNSEQTHKLLKESSLMTEYHRLNKAYDEAGASTQTRIEGLYALDKVCYEIGKDSALCDQVKSQSEKLFEDIHSRAKSYEEELKPTLKKGIKLKI
ncbi:MAG: toprim domain-containing protein [Alphaproteobacteria bacterium]|nr:toprim domain-containing protein [Alphaproteobacteria bacterium]